ncbi:unnamed protein product [Effrenium voratum]|uniref:Uncharacterized protein n=1 Tax=Effrenium voratum TaxID=2562239 RepID=A0AA36N2G2_9DINO|nr:unnamed protein product [Effrenium voratum]
MGKLIFARRLQEEILLSAGWEFPLGTKLAFDSQLEASAFGSGAAAALSLTLLAGYRYSLVAISVPEDFKFGIDHNQAVVSLVVSSITRDSCARSAYAVSMALVRASLQTDSFVPSTLADGQLLRLRELLSDGTMIGQTATFPHVSFMHGGDYQLCYSPDGSMAGNEFLNNIVPVSIRVIGVSSSCIGNGCLANERWDCFISYRLESASRCLIDFRSFGGGRDGWQVEAGTYSKTAWSAAWVQDTYLAGEFVPAPRKRCSDVSTLEYIQPEVDIFETFSWAPPTGLGFITDTVTAMDMPALKPSSATGSYSLTACYCPNYDGPQDPTVEPCDHASEYIQPIGVIYYWLLRICDAGNTASCGPQAAAPFMRVLPQQPFSLRLQCPPGGDACTGSAENRVKFLPGFCPLCSLGESSEQIPIWDIGSRCRSGDAETSHMIFHPSVDEDGNPLDEAAYRSGGTNRDYKFWETPNLIGKLPMSERVVVCYCDVACHNFQNFFEVGEIRMADSAGVARWSKPGSQFQLIQPIETVEYPGKPGGITLFAGIRSNISEGMHPYDSIPWRRKSIMKILSFDSAAEYTAASSGAKVTLEEYLNLNREDTALGRRGLDTACAVNATSAGTVNGPATEDVSAQFAAWVGPEASQYLPFTGIENDQTFEFYLAGTYVVCYCSFLTTAGICDDTGYIWAATILLKGSRTNQQVLLPTNFVVRIDLEGWGFTSQDTLRLITQTQTCSENANNPKGVVDGFRLGCPGVDGLTCRKPVVEEDVSVMLISAEATGFYIESVIMEQTRTILVFNGAVTSEVLDGDQITLDESSILLNGRGQLSWTDYERHIVSKFSGWPAFADEPESQRMLWNRVSHTDAPNQLSIPLGWAEADRPELTFLNNKGLWHRRNRLQTQEEIKADAAASLKICWGARDGGNQEYYGEAGVLTFASPAPMAAAGLYFTSLAGGSEAPAVISFTPTRGKVDYRRQTSIVLRILFKEMPRSITPLTTSRVEMGDNETVASEDMSQAVCGSLFLEMWTNDVSGFPLPKGCYYGPLYTDFKDPNGQEQPSYREYFIEFEPRHSLRDRCTDELSGRAASCVYQLVLNMRIQEAEFQLGKEIMSLYTLCAGRSGYATVCGPRYGVIEYGQVFPILPVRAPALNATRLGRVEVLPFEAAQRVGSRGLGQDLEDLMLEASEVLEDGSDGLSLGLRAWAKEAAYPIQAGARLQLIFRPLTLWSLSPVVSRNCNASCLAAPGLTCDDVRGPGMVGCQLKALVDTATVRDVPMQQNILEMQLPNLMDEMPEHRADEAHLLKLLHLKLPREGFFKTCMLATYSEDGMPPSVVEVEPCMKKAPAPGVTTGQILVDGQAGNGPKPFAFERDNEIIVRLTLGATLRNMLLVEAELPNETGTELVPGQAAQVQVLLPEGYSCTVVGNGTADPLGEKSFFKQDLNNDGFVDNPASTVFSGQWSWDGSMCKYSLESTAALFANQFIDVRLSVQNPLRPLLKTDERNRWHIQLITSEGDVLGPPAQFMSLEEEVPGWVGNLAVLGTLEGESLQPSNFTNHAENTLRVFFQMTRNMPEHSLILLDAPPGYDFTLSCQVHELETAYYQDWEALPWAQGLTGAQGPTGAFGTDVNCSADDWQRPADIPTATAPFTRAILRIGRTLLLGKYYGFAILVQNPGEWNLTQHDEWRLWLQSPEGYMVDGSRYSVQFNAARVDSLPVEPHDRGWAVYPSSTKLPLYFDFGAPRLLPTAAFATSAFLTVYALTPSTNGVLSSLRVIAPLGYVWMPDAEEGWLGYVPNVTCKYCELIVSPVVRFQNELILPDLVMRINQAFGFRVRVYVPMRPPTRSTNAFFLEIGFDPGTEGRERMQAAMIEAPKIRVVHDVFIESRCNLAGFKENVMDFSLRIASPLEVNEGFLFAGDELTRGTVLRCWPSELPSAPLSVTAAQGSCVKVGK